jgi:serine protease AprX
MKHTRKALVLATAVSVIALAYQADDRVAGFSFSSPMLATTQQGVEQRALVSTASNGETVAILQQVDGSTDDVIALVTSNVRTANASYAVANNQSAASQFGPSPSDATDAPTPEQNTPVAPRAKMSGPVAALAGGSGDVELIVRYDQHPEFFDDQRVAELGGTVIRSYDVLNMRAIRIPAAVLEELAVDENIDWLSIDEEVMSTSFSSRVAANVPTSSSANVAFGGNGIGVAVIDTGVHGHSDLDSNIKQYSFLNGNYPMPTIVGGMITQYNDSPREDLFGHGTHVAGIVSGNGADSGNAYKGTATGASVLSLQVLGANGGGSISDVMAALDWLLVYGSYFDIRVANLSLGMAVTESNATDPLVIAVEDLWDAGIVVVIAAGNYGYHGNQTVTSPANSRKVITVGSLTDNGTGTDHSDDYVSSFSSKGPTYGDSVLKPDLVAPGNRIVATIPDASVLATDLSERVVSCTTNNCSSNYLEMSGTSMATPLVSAAVARMLQKDPTLTPATVKARLMRSAQKFDVNFVASGAGMLDVNAAMNDTGVVSGEALSPLMYDDVATNGIVIEDTGVLWGDSSWSSGYLFADGFGWASDYTWTDGSGVTSSGFGWTDGGSINASGFGWTDGDGISASGFGWTDGGIEAKGFGWTDGGGAGAQSLLVDDENGLILNDDSPE